MQNNYTGEVPIKIGRETLTLVYDWEALSVIHTRFPGAEIGALISDAGPRALAAMVAIGLARHHPEWTEAEVMKASPAVRPTVNVVVRAINIAYHGSEDLPEDVAPNPPMRRLIRWVARLLTRSAPVSAPRNG